MSFASSNIGVGRGFVSITPGASPLAASVRMIRCNVGGTVVGRGPDGTTATFVVADGEYLIGEFTHILAGTTATGIVGYR